MKTVRAKEIEIPTFGLFINRTINIICGECELPFKDKPVKAKNMVSKCPFCGTTNRLPITEN
jgi:hypothetical protein